MASSRGESGPLLRIGAGKVGRCWKGTGVLSSSVHLSELLTALRALPGPRLVSGYMCVSLEHVDDLGCLALIQYRGIPRHGPECQSLGSSFPQFHTLATFAKEKQRQAAWPKFLALGTESWSSLFPGLAPTASSTCCALSPFLCWGNDLTDSNRMYLSTLASSFSLF